MADVTLTLRAVNEAKSALEETERQLKNLGGAAEDANTKASAGGGWRQGVQDMRDLTVAAQGTIAIVKGVADAVGETVERGNQVKNATRAFDAYVSMLGEDVPGALNALRDATAGTLSDFDLMQAGSKLAAMGLAENTEQMAQLTEIATVLGGAMGKGPTAAIEEFSLMLANKSIPRLDTFGISASKVRERMKELKDAGMDADSAFRLAVIEDAGPKLEAMGGAADIAGAGISKLQARFQNLGDSISQGVSGAVNDAATAFDQLLQIGEIVFSLSFGAPKIDFDLASEIETQMAGAGATEIQIKAMLDDPSVQTMIADLRDAGYPDATIAAILGKVGTPELAADLAALPPADIYVATHDDELVALATKLSKRFGTATVLAVLEDPTLAVIIDAIDAENAKEGGWSDAQIDALIGTDGFSGVVDQIIAYTGWPAAKVGADLAVGGLKPLADAIVAGKYNPATATVILAPGAKAALGDDIGEIKGSAGVSALVLSLDARTSVSDDIGKISGTATADIEIGTDTATPILSGIFDTDKNVALNVSIPDATSIQRVEALPSTAAISITPTITDEAAVAFLDSVEAAPDKVSISITPTITDDAAEAFLDSVDAAPDKVSISITPTITDDTAIAFLDSVEEVPDIVALSIVPTITDDAAEAFLDKTKEFRDSTAVINITPTITDKAALVELERITELTSAEEGEENVIGIVFDETPINELEQRLLSIDELAGQGIVIETIVNFERVEAAIEQLVGEGAEVTATFTMEDRQGILDQFLEGDLDREAQMRVRASGQEAVLELLAGKAISVDAVFGAGTNSEIVRVATLLGSESAAMMSDAFYDEQIDLFEPGDLQGIRDELTATFSEGIPVAAAFDFGGVELLQQFSDSLGVSEVEIGTTFNTATMQKKADEAGEDVVMAIDAKLGAPEALARSLLDLDLDPLQIQAAIGTDAVEIEDLDGAAQTVAAQLKGAMPPIALQTVVTDAGIDELQQQFVDAGVSVPAGLDLESIAQSLETAGWSEIAIAAFIEDESVASMRHQMKEAGIDDTIIDVTLAGGATEEAQLLTDQLIEAANAAERIEEASQSIGAALGVTDVSGLVTDLMEAVEGIERFDDAMAEAFGLTNEATAAWDEFVAVASEAIAPTYEAMTDAEIEVMLGETSIADVRSALEGVIGSPIAVSLMMGDTSIADLAAELEGRGLDVQVLLDAESPAAIRKALIEIVGMEEYQAKYAVGEGDMEAIRERLEGLGLDPMAIDLIIDNEGLAGLRNAWTEIASSVDEVDFANLMVGMEALLATGQVTAEQIEAVTAAFETGGVEAAQVEVDAIVGKIDTSAVVPEESIEIPVTFVPGGGEGGEGVAVSPLSPEGSGITATQEAADAVIVTMTEAEINFGAEATLITETEAAAENIVNLLTSISPIELGLDAQLITAQAISAELGRTVHRDVIINEIKGDVESAGSF